MCIRDRNEITHKNNDKNSLTKPLENEIIPDDINITKINQSAAFNPKASI